MCVKFNTTAIQNWNTNQQEDKRRIKKVEEFIIKLTIERQREREGARKSVRKWENKKKERWKENSMKKAAFIKN